MALSAGTLLAGTKSCLSVASFGERKLGTSERLDSNPAKRCLASEYLAACAKPAPGSTLVLQPIRGNGMKRIIAITACLTIAVTGHANAQTFTFTTPAQSTAGTTYITAGQQFQLVDPQFGINETTIQSNEYISADQFASSSDLNSAIATVNSSLNGLSTSVNGQNATIASLNSSVANLNSMYSTMSGSLASLQTGLADLKSESLSGISLAAALTPVLPTDGKANHINFATSYADGFQAASMTNARCLRLFLFCRGRCIYREICLGQSWNWVLLVLGELTNSFSLWALVFLVFSSA